MNLVNIKHIKTENMIRIKHSFISFSYSAFHQAVTDKLKIPDTQMEINLLAVHLKIVSSFTLDMPEKINSVDTSAGWNTEWSKTFNYRYNL